MKEQISNSVKMELSMPDKPDQILVEQSQAGYSEAFGLLAKKYQRKVYEIAYRFTQNVDEASDLSQEVFIKVYRALPNFESSSTFYTWLYRIAHNAGIDYTRRRKTRSEHLFSDEFQISHSDERPTHEQEAQKVDPLSLDRSPEEKTLDIVEGQRGISYEKLFLPYLKGAKLIKICDPYIRYNTRYTISCLFAKCSILQADL